MSESHFETRCLEHGISPESLVGLWDRLHAAIVSGDDATAQKVMPLRDAKTGRHGMVYRFHVAEGVFYAVAGLDGRPRTVFTQYIMRKKKWARKQRKRGRVR